MIKLLYNQAGGTGLVRREYQVDEWNIHLYAGGLALEPNPRREWLGFVAEGGNYSSGATQRLQQLGIGTDMLAWPDNVFGSGQILFRLVEANICPFLLQMERVSAGPGDGAGSC